MYQLLFNIQVSVTNLTVYATLSLHCAVFIDEILKTTRSLSTIGKPDLWVYFQGRVHITEGGVPYIV